MIATAFAGRASALASRCAGQRIATSRYIFNAPRTIETQKVGFRRPQSTSTRAGETRATITEKAGPIEEQVSSQSTGNAASIQQNGASTAANSATAQTIPIPGSNWLAPFQVPLRHYTAMNRRRPYLTQLLSTLTIWLLGDLSAQYITSSPAAPVGDGASSTTAASNEQAPGEAKAAGGFWAQYDPSRTARALIIGGIASIPSYRWFLWLGESFNFSRSKALSISVKVVFNQLTFTPVFNCYFFGMQTVLTAAMAGTLADLRAAEVWERLTHTVPRSWLNSWKVWPAVTAFSFWAVPVDLRSIFAGVIAIGWQTYLSILNQRAARLENAEHAAGAAPAVQVQRAPARACPEEKAAA